MPVGCQVCGSWRLCVWEPLRLEGFGEPWSAWREEERDNELRMGFNL